MPGDSDPYTTREIKDKFDAFGRDLAEIKALLTGKTFVLADVYNVEHESLKKADSDTNTRIDTMQSTVRALAIALVGAVLTAIVTAIITVHT